MEARRTGYIWVKSFAEGVERRDMGVEVGSSNGRDLRPDDCEGRTVRSELMSTGAVYVGGCEKIDIYDERTAGTVSKMRSSFKRFTQYLDTQGKVHDSD